MSKQYRVILSEVERATLTQRITAGTGSARELARARILLKADGGPAGPAWTDEAISVALDIGRSTQTGGSRLASSPMASPSDRSRPARS